MKKTKICKICKVEKPRNEFYKNGHSIKPECKPCFKVIRRERYIKNREKEITWVNRSYVPRPRVRKTLTNEEKEIKKARAKAFRKEYYKKNKSRLDILNREARKKRLESNPLFRLRCSLSVRTYQAFRSNGWKKKGGTENLIGCNFNIAMFNIERQFTKGMNWGNYGEWHIDHIIPLSSATTEKNMIELCHYSNLQPLWAKDNYSKSGKILSVQIPLRL